MTENEAVEVVQRALGSSVGQCYVASEAVYHLLGGKESGYTPMQVWIDHISHWYLRAPDGRYVDPTADQFWPGPAGGPIEHYHELGRGTEFMTAKPSNRTREIIASL